ncbi:MAG: DsbA family protein [Acidiferrobacterales bacterium]
MHAKNKPPLRVTVFSDYVCPFCYIGSVRLEHLRDEYELKIDWRFMEIHPDNPPEGRPVETLGYPPQQWQQMMANLYRMAEEEGVHIAKHTFTTNSHRALLLAEVAKEEGEGVFYRLHNRLFAAYLGEGQNIGDEDVLRGLANESGVSAETVERAWQEDTYEQRLKSNLVAAARLGITGTPTFVLGKRMLVGAVPTTALRVAAKQPL